MDVKNERVCVRTVLSEKGRECAITGHRQTRDPPLQIRFRPYARVGFDLRNNCPAGGGRKVAALAE